MTQKNIAPNIPTRVTAPTAQKVRPRNIAQYRSHDEEATLARARFASMLAAQSEKEAPREAPQEAPSTVTLVEPIASTGTDTAAATATPKAPQKRSHKKKTVRTDDLALAAPAPTQEDKATVERLFQSPWGAQPKSRCETLEANEAAREELAATLARFEEAHKKEAEAQEPQKVDRIDKVDFGREETSPVARPFETFEDVERPAPADTTPSADRGASPKSAKAPASPKASKVTKTPKSSKTATTKKKAKTTAASTPSAVDATNVTDASTTTAPSLEDVAALEDLEGFDLDGDPATTVATHPSTQRLLGSNRADATSTRLALSKALNSAAKDVAASPEAPKEAPAEEDATTPMFTRLRERRTALPPENTSTVFDDLNTPELDAALDEIGTTGSFSGGSQAFFALCERAIRARAEAREAAQKGAARSEFADAPQAETAPLADALNAVPGASDAPDVPDASDSATMDAPAAPSQAEFEYLQKDGEALFMRDNFEASRTTDRLTGRIRPNESREDRAQDLVKIAAEIDDVVARTRAAAQKDATDPRLCEATWVAGGLISDYIALLELERRTAAEEAEKLAREGVAVFLDLPALEPEPLTPTQAWSAALNKRQSAAEDEAPTAGALSTQTAQAPYASPDQKHPLPSANATPASAEALEPKSAAAPVTAANAPADAPVDTPIPAEGVQRLRASNVSNVSIVWRAMLSGVAGALLVAGCTALWEAYSPSPVLVTADRERLREETALLRLAHTRPGMPERADLRGLDAHAIDQAIAAAHSASAGANLPLVDTNLLLEPSSKVLDITNDVRLRLGIRPSDLATLEAAVREGWSAAPAFNEKAPSSATTPDKTNAPKTSTQTSTKASPKTTAQATGSSSTAAVVEGGSPKPGTSGNTKGTQLLEAASYAEAHPEAEGQDLDFSSRVRRVVARLRGFSEEVFR